CGKCAEACPYSAIVDIIRPCVKVCPVDAINMDENDIAVIDKDKCINCGACVTGCPFGAISDVSMITNVINLLLDKSKKVYAVIAPSIQGQFGKNISLGMIKVQF
ncbi:MAG TPA: 4Fe-4S binding protein, partial [Clostridia bacterium]|nr:4Fe-4S binding protein [Clostridia bacterium]